MESTWILTSCLHSVAKHVAALAVLISNQLSNLELSPGKVPGHSVVEGSGSNGLEQIRLKTL